MKEENWGSQQQRRFRSTGKKLFMERIVKTGKGCPEKWLSHQSCKYLRDKSWNLGRYFSGGRGNVGLTVGLDDLGGHFQDLNYSVILLAKLNFLSTQLSISELSHAEIHVRLNRWPISQILPAQKPDERLGLQELCVCSWLWYKLLTNEMC